jgi:N-acetylglucosamine-6-sulfatase
MLAAVVTTAAVAAGSSSTAPTDARAVSRPHHRPNVVVVMSDDQTLESLRVMPHVLSEIGDHGATFDNFFVNFSQCCPSRSTFLTGDYAQNHHVLGNVPPRGGFNRFERFNGHNDLPLWMKKRGYRTSEVGKYLNGYGDTNPTLVPPGWDDFAAVSRTIRYYNYKLNVNGVLEKHGSDPRDYIDRVLTDKATSFIDTRAQARKPFFLYVAYKSPHVGGPHPSGQRCVGGPEPAAKHFGEFQDEPLPESPSFNEADVSDKPAAIRKLPLLDDREIAGVRRRYQCELEALQGVDDGVDKIVAALRSQDVLGDTLLIFESDNGLMHGEHRIRGGKVRLYEPSIHVPLLMRGPGIPAGVHIQDLAVNADIAPTILDAAGAKARRPIDGQSLLPDMKDPRALSGRRLLIESKSYDAVRTARYIYAKHRSGEEELYDLEKDPDELHNVAGSGAYAEVRNTLATNLVKLRDCAGRTCRRRLKLKLRLNYQRGRARAGKSCARPPVVAKIVGDHLPSLHRARFHLNQGRGQSVGSPFKVTLRPGEMHSDRYNRVRVKNDLIDGRLQTLAKAFPRAC